MTLELSVEPNSLDFAAALLLSLTRFGQQLPNYVRHYADLKSLEPKIP
jgi:hypothetical protein